MNAIGIGMKKLTFLFLTLLFLLVSCNEKVAEGLRESDPGSSGGGGVISPTIQSMSVVSKMNPDLSYVMHKAGSLDEACVLKPPAGGLKAEDYTKADGIRNVDCILDAEELDLHFQDTAFEIQVENKMCEYVQYQPYRYFAMQPGNTKRTIFKTACDDVCGGAQEDLCNRYYLETTGPGDLGGASIFTDDVTKDFEDKKLCVFDHTGIDTPDGFEFPNCDIGQVNVVSYRLNSYFRQECSDGVSADQATCEAANATWFDGNFCNGDGEPTGTINVTRFADDDEEVECGGDLKSCLAGPGADDYSDGSSSTIYYSEANNFKEEIVIASPMSKDLASNRYVANFSRICADTSSNKTSPSIFDTLVLNGAENERIAYSYTDREVDVNGDGIMDADTYADHPFSGNIYDNTLTGARRSTSPYYAIRCLDRARDVKAQIRLYIRDWDREFSQNDLYLSRVSDFANEAGNLSKIVLSLYLWIICVQP